MIFVEEINKSYLFSAKRLQPHLVSLRSLLVAMKCCGFALELRFNQKVFEKDKCKQSNFAVLEITMLEECAGVYH